MRGESEKRAKEPVLIGDCGIQRLYVALDEWVQRMFIAGNSPKSGVAGGWCNQPLAVGEALFCGLVYCSVEPEVWEVVQGIFM